MKKICITIVTFVLTIFSSFGQDGWTTEYMTTWKDGMGAAKVGSKVFFGGGRTSEGVTGMVEIYNSETQKWTYENLAIARFYPKAISCGSKVLFAGGMDNIYSTLDIVEIFDTATGQWATAQLSQSVFDLSAVTKGNKILFAGGGDFTLATESDKVDIYNIDSDAWTTDFLSEPRGSMGAAVVGDVALFAGGLAFSNKSATDKVDIYNFSNGSWGMARLSQARFGIAAATLGDKVFFAGGELANGELSKRIDIYDYSTQTWTMDSLSVARAYAGADTVCGKIYFVGGMKINPENNLIIGDFNVIDIYDSKSDLWTVEYLPYNLFGHSTISVENQLFVAGGGTILDEFIQLRKEVRIMTCTTVGEARLPFVTDLFTMNPNPVTYNLYISMKDVDHHAELLIIDMIGTVVYNKVVGDIREIELSTDDFAEGLYVVQIQSKGLVQSEKFIIVR